MLVNIVVDGDIIDKSNDEEVNVDYEMGDKVEDIKVKVSLIYAGVDPAHIDLYYNNKKWENSVDFMRMNYEPYSKIFCRKKVNSCTCTIF